MQPEQYETGSGGFVWKNMLPSELFSKVQLHVYAAFNMSFGKEWAGDQFINHYNRIYYVKSGEAVLRFKDRDLVMKPGKLYLIPPYQLVSHYTSGNIEFMWTHFQARIDTGVDLFMFYGNACEVDCMDKPAIKQDFIALIELMSDNTSSALFERNRLLLSLLHPFMCLFDKTDTGKSALRHQDLLPALALIDRAIENPPDIRHLASQMNMSPEHFSRKFKQAFNVSPKRYVLQKRIGRAKQQLLLKDNSIERVAEQCGFCDIFHFSRTFKKETGMSPSEFRKSYEIKKSKP